MTGFTLPGMMELPGWTAGREISWIPDVGPLPSHRMSSAIFMSETATVFRAPWAFTKASLAPWASKWFSASLNASSSESEILSMVFRANFG